MATQAEIAWFAGIFEGEGTFEMSKRSTVRMTVAMSDLDVIERLERVFPSGRAISVRDYELNRLRFVDPKPIYVWRLSNGQQVADCISAILPWLGARRSERAREVLAHLQNRQQPGEPRSTHCAQGHPLTADNLIRRGGQKPYVRCKVCATEKDRAYRERRRAGMPKAG